MIAWVTWGAQIAVARGWSTWAVLETIAFVGVSLSAVTITALTDGVAGRGAYFSRFGRWRVGAQWYAVALLFTPLLSAAAIGIHLLLGGTHQLGPQVPLGRTPLLLASQLITHHEKERPMSETAHAFY